MEKQTSKQALEGQRVVVLGASSGIGLATAIAAAEAGADVVIVSGNQERLNAALKQLPAGSEGHAVDLAQEAHIQAFFEGIGTFDHLVYTAGENLVLNDISNTVLTAAQQFFNVRYWGAFAAVKYGAPHIRKGGSINLTGGIAGQRPNAGWGVAASICSAMEGFTRAMAVELAPLRVNLVSPGVVRTNLWNGMEENDRENLFTTISNALLSKRIGVPEDIAQTFLYMMQQHFATGQVITVDGGGVLI